MADDDCTPIVLVAGSSTVLAGWAGDDAPKYVEPCLHGQEIRPALIGSKPAYRGDQALDNSGALKLTRPIVRGVVEDWDLYEGMLHHTFYNGLRAAPEEHPVLVTGTTQVGRAQPEKVCQILFETFNVPAMVENHSNILTLYASGRTCGTVLEVGEGLQQSMSIYSGYAIPRSVRQQNMAGEDVTRHLLNTLKARGLEFSSDDLRDYYVVKQLKEDHCSAVSLNPLGLDDPGFGCFSDFRLPDGKKIQLTHDERHWCQEILFQPNFANKREAIIPIQEMVYDSIMEGDVDLRKDLYGNVVVAGGGSMPRGFADRLTKEITNLAPATMRTKVIAPPERKFSVWIGGSILSSLSNFISLWICKEEYDESGPAMIHRKVFRV